MAYRMQRAVGLFQTAPVVSSWKRASVLSSRSALATPRFVRSQSHLSKSSGVSFTSFPNIINGKPRFGSGSYKGENPSNKEQLWDVPIATSEEVDEAVAAAKQAFPAWSRLSQQDRVTKIKAWVDDFIAHEEELKEVLIQETGKPVRQMIFLSVKGDTSQAYLGVAESNGGSRGQISQELCRLSLYLFYDLFRWVKLTMDSRSRNSRGEIRR